MAFLRLYRCLTPLGLEYLLLSIADPQNLQLLKALYSEITFIPSLV
jgi:hypothetical protein